MKNKKVWVAAALALTTMASVPGVAKADGHGRWDRGRDYGYRHDHYRYDRYYGHRDWHDYHYYHHHDDGNFVAGAIVGAVIGGLIAR